MHTMYISANSSSDPAATLVHLLRGRAISQSEQWAYSFLQDGEDKEIRLSYGQLDRQARAIAIRLQALAGSGERALLLYPPGLEYITAFFGCLYAGLIPVPAYPPRLNRNFLRLQALVTDAQATIALTTTALYSRITAQFSQHPLLQELSWLPTDQEETSESKREEQEIEGWQEPSLSGEDLAFLQYTSGSTGQPKGVMVTHANLLHNLAQIQQKFEHTPHSVGVSWLPPYHDMGLIGGILQPLFVGFPCILLSPTAFLERPLRWLQAISHYQATTSGGPNFAYEYCLRKIPGEQRVGFDLHHWSVAFTGAEPVHQETLEAFAAAFAPCGFHSTAWYPCYGLAEATLMVSGGKRASQPVVCAIEATALEKHEILAIEADQPMARKLISCGQSLSDQQIKIVNPETFHECQSNQVGEIWLAGPSIAQGYWNHPAETESTFHAFLSETEAGPFLRTGDLGFLQDERLFVTGRLKDLLIIRGRNHYPQDIEATVGASHPALRPGNGATFSIEQDQQERLVVVQEVERQARTMDQQEFTAVIDAIRAAVSEQHELQVYSVVLIKPGSLLKTSSGKIQRQACRAAFLAGNLTVLASSTLASDAVVKCEMGEEKTSQLSRAQLLATSVEERGSLLTAYLQQLIAEELHVAPHQIKPEQPINTLGLDSLTATHLSAQLEDTLGISVPLTSFLQGMSLAQLCAQMLEDLPASASILSLHTRPIIEHDAKYHSLSFAQERFWFLDQLESGNPAYTIAGAAHLSGPLHVAALEHCWNDLIQRHEVLRTTFAVNDGYPVQVIAPALSLPLAIVDLRTGSKGAEEDQVTIVQQMISAEVERPFDLAHGPLLRVTLWRLAPEEHVILLTLHHSIADGWSMGVLVRELGILYQAYIERQPSPLSLLPALPLNYVDFARWQRDWLQGEVRTQELAYWQKQLTGAPAVLELLTDRPRSARQSFRGAIHRLSLPLPLIEALKALGQREGVTLFMTLLAAFQVLLSRYSGQEDIVVGTPVANRTHVELEGMIGCFINLLALRTDLTGHPTFQELLRRVRKMALAAYAHQSVPFEQVVEAVQPGHDLSHTPLFQVLFVLQNTPRSPLELAGVSSRLLEMESNSTQFDLILSLEEAGQGLEGSFQYNTDLFEAATIARMAAHWHTLLQGIVTDPSRPLWEYPLLSDRERQQLLIEWNVTQAAYPHEAVIHQLFEAQVERSPDAIAVVYADQQLTYRELNTRANQLAHYLHRLGVGPEVLVGLCLQRSLDLVVGLLGILKAGGAYVPLDPTYPKERLAFIIEDTQAPFLLTQEQLAAQLFDAAAQFGSSRVMCLDGLASVIGQESTENVQIEVKPEHLAYVIYTSGSTGQPKGVLIDHGNLVHSTTARTSYYSEPVKGYLLLSSFAFDSSVAGIFWTLCQGGMLCLPQDHAQQNPQEMIELIAQHQLSHLLCVPSFYTYLLASATSEQLASLQVVIVAGEVCLRTLVSSHQALLPRTALSNEYGPTEATIWSTVANCLNVTSAHSVPIGRPIANTEIYILDQWQQPVPIGVPGEMYIGGVGVARGYLRRPELTAERFVPDPFSNKPDARLYRTGDLACYRADGTIEFLGRFDQQVKIRGFRIEPGEIEALLDLHPVIREAMIVAREDIPGDQRLVAYIVLQPEQPTPSRDDLRHFLQTYLPDYMIPSDFVVLEALPLTSTGKIDRRALPIPDHRRAAKLEGAVGYVAPVTELERQIAQVWQTVLRIEHVGLQDNFFDLGGHSLLLIQVQQQLRLCLQRELSLVDLFTYPTVSALAYYLEPTLSRPEERERARQRDHQQPALHGNDIAIIGMAGRFPGANTVEEFWANLQAGVESITTFSDEELAAAGVPESLRSNPRYVKAGGILTDVDCFDAPFFDYSPREAELMDPQHRLFLEAAWHALENAGYDPSSYPGSIGVYAGMSISTYLAHNLLASIDTSNMVDVYQMLIANDKDFLSTRVSYKLNLRGPSMAVQTACSTSLVAVHLACESLRTGQCDMALAGGVSVGIPTKQGYLYQEGGVLSPDGHCRTFDAQAQGMVRGSGLGIVVLKRLADALTDGDHIAAVIKGSAINNDGALKVGYTAPSVQGQAHVIEEALALAGVAPETVSYVEAHGTATPLGDPIEVAALTQAFQARTHVKVLPEGQQEEQSKDAVSPMGWCALGSVKSNIGHLDAAAGVAGLLKTVLALQHHQLPASLHFHHANPQLNFADSPFRVNDELIPWESNGHPRRAGVSSFGIGGTNAHLLLEEAPPIFQPIPHEGSSTLVRPWQLLILSAKTKGALERQAAALATHLHQHPNLCLADVAYTLQIGRHAFSHRCFLVCQDITNASTTLITADPAHLLTALQDAPSRSVVFLFPGQGSQYVGMGQDLYQSEPIFRSQIDHCADLLLSHLELDLRQVLYPALYPGMTTQEASYHLSQIWLIQPALFVFEYALATLWLAWGIHPQALLGHSLGEYVAACLAGVFSLEDALTLVAMHGRLLQQTSPEAMQALPSDEKQFAQAVAQVRLQAPRQPYLSNVTGTWITAAQATDPQYWVHQLRQPVRFVDTIADLVSETSWLNGQDGQSAPPLFLEVGPGQSLSALACQHPALSQALVLASLPQPQTEQAESAFLLSTLGKLWLAGVPVDWRGLYPQQHRQRLPLPTYPFERLHYWMGPIPATHTAHLDLPSTEKRRDVADWFSLPCWKQALLPQHIPLETLRDYCWCWLVFSDTCGVGSQFISDLEQAGQLVITVLAGDCFSRVGERTYTINPQQQQDYSTLLASLASLQLPLPQKIVHLWSVTADDPAHSTRALLKIAQTLGFSSLLYLVQMLSLEARSAPIHLWVISNNVQEVSGEEMLRPEKATILGPCKVIPQEYPQITCSNVDIVLSTADPQAMQELSALLISEMTTQDAEFHEPTVAYRGKQRWVQTFEPVHLASQTEGTVRLREGGVYLITGGLGRIGFVLADYLTQQVQANLVLVGRSEFPARSDWNHWLATHTEQDAISQKIRKVQALEQHGAEVLVCCADVADLKQMQAVIHLTEEHFGSLHGIIHAAGIVGEKALCSIAQTGVTEQDIQFRPKIQGLLVLAQVLEGRTLDFCLLFSSLSAILGGLGFASYAAANVFMDTFARQQRSSHLIPWSSINWDGWESESLTISPNMQRAGLAITTAEGGAAFAQAMALSSQESQLVISKTDLKARLDAWINPVVKPIGVLQLDQTKPAELGSLHPRPDLPMAYVPPVTELEQQIAQVWQNVLHIENVGLQDTFFDLGGHSLLLVQVHQQLCNRLQRDIALIDLFNYPTISALAQHLQPAAALSPIMPTKAVPTSQAAQMEQSREHATNQGLQHPTMPTMTHHKSDVAIIGITGRFPGANTLEEFWTNLQAGVESITFFSDEELAAAGVPEQARQDPHYVKAGGVLADVDCFDAAFFGYSPREAELMDPQHRLFLEAAWHALENAGYDPSSYPGSIGVYAGQSPNTYFLTLLTTDPTIIATIGRLQLALGNSSDTLATQVSYKLNLRGPSINVQTACSTSLVAIHQACRSLVAGECDMALAGGVSVQVPHREGYLYEEGGITSPDGHCRTFDAQAQGTVFTSGLGIVVLKRLVDALTDGDSIVAVIKGSAINNDGALKVGYTAPSMQGQAQVIEKALAVAGLAPETVSYVEAHGTATPMGDPIEIAALTQAFQAQRAKELPGIPAGWCALGSVKSNIGHLDAASGVAGLLKTVLALQHRQLPPSLHFHQANPQLDFAHSPFRVNEELIPWESNGHPRRAGVSSFGIGGTNAHLLLEEAPHFINEDAELSSGTGRPWQLLILSAKTQGALDRQTEALATHLHLYPNLCLANVAYTLQVGRHAFSHRRFLVCQDTTDASIALATADSARLLTALQEAPSRSVVFLFPGQGSQYIGMGQDLYQSELIFRSQIDHCADLLQPHLELDLRQVLYPALYPGMTTQEASHHLGQTWLTQPALFVLEYALAMLWLSWGVQPQALLGHSVGEYVAACLAGVFSLEDALALIAIRGRLLQQTSPGAMLALSLAESAVEPLLQAHGQNLSLAAINGPQQCVVSGPLETILALDHHLATTGVATRRLQTSHAFHSPLVDPALEPFAQAVARVHLQAPCLPYLSNVTGTWITATQATDPQYWVQQLRQPVRFADNIAELVGEANRINGQDNQSALPLLLEVGPGQTLSALARQHPTLSRRQVLASLPHPQTGQSESAFLLMTLGKLWLAGIAVDWRGLYPQQHRQRLPLPTYPFERQRYWLAASPAGRVTTNVTMASEPEQVKQNGNNGSLHVRSNLLSAYVPPESEIEQRMAAIWQSVLGIDHVGRHDTFFELGGHSVLATQLMAQVRTAFHVNVPLRHLFETPTVAGLAEAVVHHQHLLAPTPSVQLLTTIQPDQPALVPDQAQWHLPFPLTDVQQAYWLGRSGELELSNVATHGYIEFEGTMLDLERFTQAMQLLIARHGMLRAIILPDGQQQILENVPPYQINTLDLRNQAEIVVEAQLANLRQQLSHQVLPADQWPLFEIRATLLDGQLTRVHVSLDMLIMDAWSIQLLGRELAQLYTNPQAALPPLDLSFRDYVLADLALRDTETYKRAQTYWRSRLAELPPAPALPLAQSPSALTHPRFVRYSTRLEKKSWQRLKIRAAQAALTPSGVLLAAFAQVLTTWSSSPRFTLNLTLFNRLPLHPQVNDVVGDFTSLTLLTVDYSKAASFEERARHLQEQLWTDLDHRLMTGVQVLRELAQSQGRRMMPMPVVFTSTLIQDQTAQSEEPAWVGEEVYSISQTPQVWLDHQVIEEAGDLVLNWDVVEALFPVGLVEAMFAAYEDLLHSLITTQEIWHLPAHILVHSLLPVGQLAQRAVSHAKDVASTSWPLLHTLFLEQAALRPTQLAVISPTQTLNYAELAERAMQLGERLRHLGARPNTLVAVVMEKGWEQVVATLGILLAGAAYLPIEPENPAERLAYLLEHGEVQLVLTQSWLIQKLHWPTTVECLSVDNHQEGEDAINRVPTDGDKSLAIHDIPLIQGSDDLAYVIYTSGSTGLPKGVMIDHRGAVNTILDINQRFRVGPEDRVLALSSLSFDLSVYDLFGTLAAGGTIVLPSAAERHDPAHWAELLVKEQVTLWNSVPALLELLMDYLVHHPELDPSSLRLALLSGDWIPLALPDRVKTLAADIEMISLGGATEASIWSICYPITEIKPSWTSIPYGKPLLNQQWYVLTPLLDPCPIWVPGHLYIGGIGLAKGYWRDAVKTAASFITHPHTGERLYRTGDLGRYLPDGTIEFLGREDFQVKVQGYRIELGEIETTLEQHPAVRATAVVAQGEAHGEKRLVAYIVLQEQQQADQLSLRSFLQDKLPAYMVPTSMIFLNTLPLTANGKVDRSQLQTRSEPSTVSTSLASALAPVPSVILEQLTRIVSDILQLEQLDPMMNLLELGASSLDMIRIMNRLEKELNFRPQFSAFYALPTIQGLGLSYEQHHQPQRLTERSEQEMEHKAELLAFLRLQKESDANHASAARPKLGRTTQQKHLPAPLSFAQQRLWFLDQLQPGSTTYTIAVAIRFVGTLQVSVLEQSLNEVVRRHESLRTTFAVLAGKPVQVITPCPAASAVLVPLVIHNLEAVPTQERENQVQQLARQEVQQPFDLAQGPLLRATLLRLEEDDQVLVLTLHHIITDGWSLGILMQELVLLYQAYTNGLSSPLPDLSIQYTDYAHWQRTWLQGEILQTQLAYWKEQLAGAPAVLELPLDYPRPAVQTFQGATHPVVLSLPLTEALRELSQREGVTLFMTLLAAFKVLLSRYSRQEDIVVGTPIANRTHAETESLIGFFVNMLVLRTDLTGNPSFSDLLRRVRDVAQAAYAHQDVPFEQVVESLQPKRELSYTPLFQVTIVLEKAPLQNVAFDGVSLHPVAIESGITQFDLNLRLEESPAGIQGAFEYNTDLFEKATIARMAEHWHTLLQGIIADPSRRLWEYLLLSEQERLQLLVEWNATQVAYPHEAVIHQLFEAQVERSPDAIAVVCADQQLTYRELNTRANQLAYYLHRQGVGPEVLVGLCMQRSLDLVVGLLGILKAGGAYVPLDPIYPRERLAFLMEDTQAPFLLTQEQLAAPLFDATVQFGKSKVICLDRLAAVIGQESVENVVTQQWQSCESVRPEHLVYVIYTSGSTGQPKGVAVSHQNLTNLVTWHCQTFHLSSADRTTQLAGIGFDASAWEIWPSLLAGASLHLPTEAIRMNPEKLRDWLVSEEITLTFLPTPLAEQMLALAWPSPIPLRTVLTGGDRLHHTPPAGLPFTLVNNYGPTENTVVTTSGVVAPQAAERSDHLSLSPAIGRPIANTHIYLLDQYLQPVPIGVPGELYISGASLARGYLHRPDLTAERFIPNPFSDESAARLYRTGDLARYRADGTIEFLGRLDQQVKIRGFRIELGEIETLLGQHPAIREVVVLAREDISGDKRLVAYVVLHLEQAAHSSSDLRHYLQTYLPGYMVPSDFIVLDALPLNTNGKVDHHALPAPNQSRPTLENAYIAPRDTWELQMAHLWETILGRHPIGVRDDFFALGGHSLLAITLMAQVKTHFGRSLPLAVLFQEATVEHLARLLQESPTEEARVPGRSAARAEIWSPLIPIQPHGTQRPFFCVHGADGTVLGYRNLARYLGIEQPFYGLQARGVEDAQEPLMDIPTMAASYLQAVRTLQPEGPYLLGGWSMGGLVAFEMAQQLVAQDQQVALLVLFDTWLNFNIQKTEASKPDLPLSLVDDATSSTELIRKLAHGDFPLWQLSEEQLEAIRKVINLSGDSSLEQVHRLLRLYQVNGYASHTYVPYAYSGRVLYFVCEKQSDVSLDSPLPNWATVIPTGLVVQQTPSDHYSMLSEPHVQLIAERLKQEIHDAQITEEPEHISEADDSDC